MAHPLLRRVFVLALAVLVTAGMGLSVVQASSMQVQMMGMASGDSNGMSTPMAAKCPDCDKYGQAKGMPGCVAPACTVLSALPPHDEIVRVAQLGLLDLRPLQSRFLNGRDTVPDPYPPRTSDIV